MTDRESDFQLDVFAIFGYFKCTFQGEDMKALILDLLRRTRDALRTINRNESVSVNFRDKEKTGMSPGRPRMDRSVKDHEAFGMWRDRDETADVDGFLHNLRNGRLDDM